MLRAAKIKFWKKKYTTNYKLTRDQALKTRDIFSGTRPWESSKTDGTPNFWVNILI